jgi:hypothetical protein
VVSPEVQEAFGDDPAYRWRALRPHHLRHIGRVRLWRVTRREAAGVEEPPEEEGESRTLRRARERRAVRRTWIAERMGDRPADMAESGRPDDVEL